MTPRLVIVQNKPTQFDVPLYEYLRASVGLDLTAYYTELPGDGMRAVDPEIGQAPIWDHLGGCPSFAEDLARRPGSDASRLADKIAARRPHLVILCGYYPPLHARLVRLLKKRDVRIGLRTDSTLRHSRFRGAKGLFKRIVLPFWLRRYDTWHPVGTLARQYLEAVAGSSRPTFLFPYNVDNRWFADQSGRLAAERQGIRAGMGIGPSDIVVLGILKWHPREDPLTLVNGFSMLAERDPAVRLVLVGDGPLRDAIRYRAGRLGAKMLLPGYVPYSELPKYYAISDVFVHPAVGEPWGVSVNEAMACGVPVLAAEGVGARADLISEGETGCVFPDGDCDRLCELLSRLARDPDRRSDMAAAARRKVASWSYEQTSGEMLAALVANRSAQGTRVGSRLDAAEP